VYKRQDIKGKLLESLKSLKYKVEVSKEEENEVHVFADKNVYARFGVYIVHLGVLIVLIGGLITAVFGFRGFMNLAEGTESNLVTLFSGSKVIELPFKVKCNKFKIDFYPSGMPKAYISDLSIVKDGREVLRKKIRVNSPLKYEGIYFYQASYGEGEVILKVASKSGTKVVGVALGQSIKLSENAYFSVISIDRGAIGVEFVKDGKSQKGVIKPFVLYEFPGTGKSVAVVDFQPVFYTGIQVSKDPGTWVVWTGSIVLILGLVIAFFVPHRRIWARIEKKGEDRARLVIGGLTNKGNESFEMELEEVLGVLKSLYCEITPKEE
jgi:cytochrome c biogenesis protein